MPILQWMQQAARTVKSVPFFLFLPLLLLLLALGGTGCVAVRDTAFSRVLPGTAAPETWRLAILPLAVSPTLKPEALIPETEWWQRLFDGRGGVVSSRFPDQEVRLGLVSTLNQAHRYQNVFSAPSIEAARSMGATAVMLCDVYDYRTVMQGGNSRYFGVFLLSPLMPQYWIRWLTIEARIDLDVRILAMSDGRELFRRRLGRKYHRTVRYAFQRYMEQKMLGCLRYEACPELVAEMFALDTAVREPAPEPVVEPMSADFPVPDAMASPPAPLVPEPDVKPFPFE